MLVADVVRVVMDGRRMFEGRCSCGWASALASRREKVAAAVLAEHLADHQHRLRVPAARLATPSSTSDHCAIGNAHPPHSWLKGRTIHDCRGRAVAESGGIGEGSR